MAGRVVLTADTSIDCNSSGYRQFLVFNILLIFIYQSVKTDHMRQFYSVSQPYHFFISKLTLVSCFLNNIGSFIVVCFVVANQGQAESGERRSSEGDWTPRTPDDST